MKRPSGFDRDSEPRRIPQPEVEEWTSQVADPATAETTEPVQAARKSRRGSWLSLPRLPSSRLPREAAQAESTGKAVPPEPSEAVTLDLSSVAEGLVAAGELSTVEASEVKSEIETSSPRPAESGLRVAERQLKEAIRGRKRRDRNEQKRFTWHVRRRRRPWLIAGAAVAFVALFVVAGVFTPLMSVREIRVEGATRVDPAAVSGALESMRGTPLALVDHGEVHRALLPFPLIQRYSVETIPPHTLVVRLEERVPVLALPTENGFDLVDPAGVSVEQHDARPEGIPLAEGKAAERSSSAFQAVARVLRDVPPELRAQIDTATASTGQDVSFVLQSGVQVVWGEAKETPRKAVVLAAMLQALGDRPVSLIDVSSSEAPIFR